VTEERSESSWACCDHGLPQNLVQDGATCRGDSRLRSKVAESATAGGRCKQVQLNLLLADTKKGEQGHLRRYKVAQTEDTVSNKLEHFSYVH